MQRVREVVLVFTGISDYFFLYLICWSNSADVVILVQLLIAYGNWKELREFSLRLLFSQFHWAITLCVPVCIIMQFKIIQESTNCYITFHREISSLWIEIVIMQYKCFYTAVCYKGFVEAFWVVYLCACKTFTALFHCSYICFLTIRNLLGSRQWDWLC